MEFKWQQNFLDSFSILVDYSNGLNGLDSSFDIIIIIIVTEC